MNVAQNLERSARLFPEHVAILTYRALEAEASCAALPHDFSLRRASD